MFLQLPDDVLTSIADALCTRTVSQLCRRTWALLRHRRPGSAARRRSPRPPCRPRRVDVCGLGDRRGAPAHVLLQRQPPVGVGGGCAPVVRARCRQGMLGKSFPGHGARGAVGADTEPRRHRRDPHGRGRLSGSAHAAPCAGNNKEGMCPRHSLASPVVVNRFSGRRSPCASPCGTRACVSCPSTSAARSWMARPLDRQHFMCGGGGGGNNGVCAGRDDDRPARWPAATVDRGSSRPPLQPLHHRGRHGPRRPAPQPPSRHGGGRGHAVVQHVER